VTFIKFPDVPVMVTVAGPVEAALLAVNVRVVEAVALVGLNEAVTPLGRPEAARLTLPLKPFCGVTVMVLDPEVPCMMLRLVGDAERAKFGTAAAVTVRLIVVACVRLPEVPVIVTAAVPVVAVPLAVRVRVLEAVPGLGLNEAVTPLGRLEAESVTLPLKPFCAVIVIAPVPLVPCVMVELAGDADKEKSGDGAGFVLIETLSKVAVARLEVLPLLTAKPMYTFCAMGIVRLLPNCTQVTPSSELYPLKLLPLRTTFTQYGNVAPPPIAWLVLPPVLVR